MSPNTEPLTDMYFISPFDLEAGHIRGRLPSGRYLVELIRPVRPVGQRYVQRTEADLVGGYLFTSEWEWTDFLRERVKENKS